MENASLLAKKVYIKDLVCHVVDQCGLIDDALLLKSVENISDGVYNYARVLCCYGSFCMG